MRRQLFRALALAASALLAPLSHADSPPNIIVILADDLGYGDLSCYGQTKFQTPRLDRMAAEGMRFTNGYAGAAVCAPSRGVFLTGLHTGHATIRANYDRENRKIPLRTSDITIAKVLKGAGYTTACIGKWGVGDAGTDGTPEKQGFDYFFGFLDMEDAHFHFPRELTRNGQRVEIPGNDPEKQTGTPTQTLFTADALDFLKTNSAKPFFLYLAYTYPHAEMSAPQEEIAAFAGKFGKEKPYRKDLYGAQSTPRAAFAAMMTMLDRDVGRILDELDTLGVAQNTLVIFTSDNGPVSLGGHDHVYFNSTGPFRGAKRSVYEAGIRVPLIARWPGKIAPNPDLTTPIVAYDFLPTFAELAGLTLPATDGVSFASFFRDGAAPPAREYIYWNHPRDGGQLAVRLGRWKGVKQNIRHDPRAPLELYDLDTDLSEAQDVAAAHPDIVARIEEIMRAAHVPQPGE